MKKGNLLKRKILSITFLALTLSMVIASVGMTSTVSLNTQTNPTPTVYLNPPTINGTAIGQEFTVNLTIRDADEVVSWSAGMIFNSTLLNCTEYKEGEFLSDAGSTFWVPGIINNTIGEISIHGCAILGAGSASNSGRLAYLTFKVKALGVSDIHLRDVVVNKKGPIVPIPVKVNIIDVYTVVLGTTPHTVVIVSSSSGTTGTYHSGFYAHAYNPVLKTLSFNVTGPDPAYANVTIPKTLLLPPVPPIEWNVIIDNELVSVTVTENATHSSLYFTYSEGIHEIQISNRMSSTISIALSSTFIILGSNVTISGNITAEDHTGRPDVNVTIQSRPIGGNWATLTTVITDLNSNYTHTWTPGEAGTYEIKASWEGDNITLGAESDVLTLAVQAFYVFEADGFDVIIETNSRVVDGTFNFSQQFKQISFNVSVTYGIVGFCNVTIPKQLLNVSTLDEWNVIIDHIPPLETAERTVTENATNYFIYFTTGTSGVHQIQITTRLRSTISTALDKDSIDLGSSVIISGSITPLNRSVSVTVQSRSLDGNWTTLTTVITDTNGNYTYAWTPDTPGTYEVKARWEGDEISIGAESNASTLTIIENSTISITLSSANITFGNSVTISGTINPSKPSVSVTIQYRLSGKTLWSAAGQNQTKQDSSYTFVWKPNTPGTYEVKASWLGDETTHNATSDVLTLTAKRTSTISITLSSANITKGKSVTISGTITATDNITRADANVTILYRLSSETEWTTLANVTTNQNSSYSYAWTPDTTETYEVMTSWEGDETTLGAESEVQSLTVKAAVIPIEIIAAVAVAIIIIAAIVVYFVKFRKPR